MFIILYYSKPLGFLELVFVHHYLVIRAGASCSGVPPPSSIADIDRLHLKIFLGKLKHLLDDVPRYSPMHSQRTCEKV